MIVRLTIDGVEVEVPEGATIMDAADEAGIDIPRFCYHPRLSAPANCRICAVEVEGREGLVMSCREPALEGMRVKSHTPAVKAARRDVLEFMLANHPIDCPICDSSGDCMLQDLYYEYSKRPSRMKESKVRKSKAKRIGPHVVLDSERCIGCTRCVRFCEEVTGSRELGIFERGDETEIGMAPGVELANPYSLCTVDLCPVGALTSSDFRFKKPAWMLESLPTVCAGCASLCGAWLDSSDGVAYRLRPIDVSDEGPWMCDEGRMSYKVLADDRRLDTPMILRDGSLENAGLEDALGRLIDLVKSSEARDVVCILSAQASMEENLAIAKLARELFGTSDLRRSGLPADPAFEDGMTRVADRNPNSLGVELIASNEVDHIPRGAGVLVLGVPHPDDVISIAEARPAWVVAFASSRDGLAGWADVVLAKPAHFEQSGTFVGDGGKVHKFERAFKCESDAITVWRAAALIAKRMGKSWDLETSDDCLAWGCANLDGLTSLDGIVHWEGAAS